MSFTEHDVLATVDRLTVTRLRAWIDSGCVRPRTEVGGPAFTEADLARLELLCALQDDLSLEDETLPLVLSLIDQIHGLRRALRRLGRAVEQQPESVRDDVARAFREAGD